MTLPSQVWFLYFVAVPLCFAKLPLKALGRYYLHWDGGMRACEGADNSIFDLTKLVVEKKSKTVLALVGDVNLMQDIDNLKVKVTINKEVNGNYEYLMTVSEDKLCNHLGEQNKPWTPFAKEMGISGCPIPAKTYTFKLSSMDTAGFPFSVAHAGHYKAQVELFSTKERKICLIAEATIQAM